MPIDYHKWDALELSDDSDIEVHPNVDKRSFIRAKQNQIHMERDQRRHQIATLKYEDNVNKGLLSRIDRLLVALQSHKPSAESASNPDEVVFQALMEASMSDDPADDEPKPPEGVHKNVDEPVRYSKMMAALVDQVKQAVDKAHPSRDGRYQGYIDEIGEHKKKVQGLQIELHKKLAELEKIEKSKIRSDDIHIGFDSSQVSKPKTVEQKKTSEPELLNPKAPQRDPLPRTDSGESSGALADTEEAGDDTLRTTDDPDDMKASPTAKKFARLKAGQYREMLQFISENPQILTEKETDGLLVEAFNAETEGKHTYSRQCVHQALLLQYCRQLGRDGVGLFFKRITTPGHQAGKLFTDDVNSTYHRIKERVAALAKEKEDEGPGVEQIQLHAVDPNTQITINVPTAEGTDEVEVEARKIFDSFPPGLQRALQSGSLDEINKVLAKMSVDEAELIVQQMGEAGMLNLEEKIIDATTDEGKERMKEIEEEQKAKASSSSKGKESVLPVQVEQPSFADEVD